ncbi:hypothetical protein RIF29_29712 [Crotalaria pallida]|uniref:Uncharacterized protein n=1 Tax=Crotalaria pallida TaxID=3830 RepID=A0AAN9I0M9_CROPI
MATEKTVMVVIRAGRPTFRNQYDKIAFAVHASFLAFDYILTATGPEALDDTAFYNSSNGGVTLFPIITLANQNWPNSLFDDGFVPHNHPSQSKLAKFPL